jgi:colanic acid biosynthesis glycosyl transferase WcaI
MYNILRDKKSLKESKINLWPNWIQGKDYVLDEARKGRFREKFNIRPEDVIIAYAGNVGLKQGLEILVDLADFYRQNDKLRFFIIGQGAALDSLQEYAANKQARNLTFLPLLGSEEYIDFLNDLDIFFLPQKKTDFDVYFPSKLLGLIAAKKMILLTADKDSELYNTIKNNNLGLTAEYGDFFTLQHYIQEILNNVDIRKEVAENSISYISQFEREVVLNRVLDKLQTI